MEVEYDFTPEDGEAFQRYHATQKDWHAPKVELFTFGWYVLIVIGGGASLALWALRVLGKRPAALELFPDTEVVLAFFLGAYAMAWHTFRLLQRTNQRSRQEFVQRNPRLFTHRRIVLDAEGIRYFNFHFESLTRWSAVLRIAATDEHIFFYVKTTEAQVVPRRAFLDDAAFDAFFDQACRYHQEAAKARFRAEDRSSPETYHARDIRFDARRPARN